MHVVLSQEVDVIPSFQDPSRMNQTTVETGHEPESHGLYRSRRAPPRLILDELHRPDQVLPAAHVAMLIACYSFPMVIY